ncbi:hypothetical protein L3X38_018885 [Prunus dulcis]|uniref:RNase H type-1 domain-containing protein n=1 Tax=Prunus dulcis TaxID=3755 RepID=A0AAD4WAV3_PRUDU|nr:hypothetical protein L3X38_018885 [Prunus dulcis]
MNQALLAKIGWRLHSRDNGLWAKIYEAKYLKGTSIFDNSLGARQVCSTTWRSILHGIQLLKQGMCWRVGRGDSVNFWEDKWVTDVPLMQQAGVLTAHNSNCSVSSFSMNGWWDIDKLRGVVREDLVQQIISVPVGFLSSLPDTQVWKALHILRDCERARTTWNAILPAYAHNFFRLDAQPWMKVNMLSKAKWNGDVPWSTVFVFTCWQLWCWRNKHVFQNEDTVPFSPRQVICGAAQEWIKSSSNRTIGENKVQIHVAWEPPKPGQFKLNVDGSRKHVTGCIGAGGVIRDSFGDWVSGFAVNLGKGQVLEAEIWGLFFGLKLAIEKGICNLILRWTQLLQ